MDDTSLDEFLDQDDERAESAEHAESKERDVTVEQGERDGAESERGEHAEIVEPATVDPATATSRWGVSTEPCSRCGADDVRLWTDEGASVCQDCKEW